MFGDTVGLLCSADKFYVLQPHQDGPAYFPVVAIVSLGSPVVMDFSLHSGLTLCTNTFRNDIEDKVSDRGAREAENDTLLENHYPFSVALMPRSLLIFKDKAYSGDPSIIFCSWTCSHLRLTELLSLPFYLQITCMV